MPIFRLLLITIALATSAAASAQSLSARAAKDELAYMDSEEPAMRKAFARAAETLPEFLALAAKPKKGTSNHALKVAISDGKNTEYFWVVAFSNKGDDFTGTLTNVPRLIKKYKQGDRITFQRAQIADWLYIDDATGKMVGNFTACALLTKEPPKQAAAFMQEYGLSCEK